MDKTLALLREARSSIDLMIKTHEDLNEMLRRGMAEAVTKLTQGLKELQESNGEVVVDGPKLNVLTERQLAIFGMIARKRTMEEIAAHFKLSKRTVEAHRNTIRLRLKFPTVADLNKFAESQVKH